MAATYDTVKQLVDIALKHFAQLDDGRSCDTGSEIRNLQAMLVEMDTVAQEQTNKSVRETFRRLLDEVSRRVSSEPVLFVLPPKTIRERIHRIYPDEQISMTPSPWHTLREGPVVFADSAGCKIIAYCTDRRINRPGTPLGEWYWIEPGWNPDGDLIKVERKYLEVIK